MNRVNSKTAFVLLLGAILSVALASFMHWLRAPGPESTEIRLVPVTLPAQSVYVCTRMEGGMDARIEFTNHGDAPVVVNMLRGFECVKTGSP